MSEASDLTRQAEVAARLAARAEIRDVRLLSTQAKLTRLPEPGHMLSYNFDLDPDVDWDAATPASFVVRVRSRLTIEVAASAESESSDEESVETVAVEEARDVASLDCEFAGLFDCMMREEDLPLEEEELISYASTTGQFLLYPYIREYVHNLTGRFALPPLTLGVLRRPMPTQESLVPES